ncbi:MAG: DUF6151 family protein [Pseudomonadota bacterium]
MAEVDFACSCGNVRGVLQNAAPSAVCHLICYCSDCRAYARHLGQMTQLEPGGGSPLVQVAPFAIDITSGSNHIACLRLSSKGLYRWYAACCDTPIANSVGTPRVPLAGMWRPLFSTVDPFGPVRTLGFTKMSRPGGPRRDKATHRMLSGLIRNALSGYTSGIASRSPFFAADRSPIVAPVVLTEADRKRAYLE